MRNERDLHAQLSEVAELGCIVCRNNGFPNTPATIHHLRAGSGMGQRGRKVIPLCWHHHLSGPRGEAFHQGRKSFEANHGTEEALWEQTQKLLKQHEEE